MSGSPNSMVCISVKSSSVFPDLLPVEPPQRRVGLGIVQVGASFGEALVGIPLFAIWVAAIFFNLANH